MRLFIAINFNSDTCEWLIALREELRAQSQRGRFSRDENLHLTLVFLGECDAKQTAAAQAAMNAVKFEPFRVAIDRVGCFKRDGGDIWWAGLRENKPLSELQRNLTDRLAAIGFTLERCKFSPHITLGREVVTDAKPWRVSPLGETISAIELMNSERIGGKLTYTAIARSKGDG